MIEVICREDEPINAIQVSCMAWKTRQILFVIWINHIHAKFMIVIMTMSDDLNFKLMPTTRMHKQKSAIMNIMSEIVQLIFSTLKYSEKN